MILGINCGRSVMASELGAGNSARDMASSWPSTRRRLIRIQTCCTAKPSMRTVATMKKMTPLRMAAMGAPVSLAAVFGSGAGETKLSARACRDGGQRFGGERCGCLSNSHGVLVAVSGRQTAWEEEEEEEQEQEEEEEVV
jgi:hypothetical protein